MILEDINKLLQKGEGIRIEFKTAEKGIPRNSSLSNTTWDEILLYLVPRWSQKGTRLQALDWPENQLFTQELIKKVPGWNEKGTRFLHKKILYILTILVITSKAIKLETLMNWMDYKNKKTFRDNYLRPLQIVEFVRKTIPNNPSSPEQQYIITEKGRLFLAGRDL